MQNKKRVIALDYFRGICMIAVVINHFMIYRSPLTYLAGSGRLWVGAAEMFFLLSGITFGIVRGQGVLKDFKRVIGKSFRRAAQLYVVNIAVVVASLSIAFSLARHGLSYNIPGNLPDGGVGKVGFDILTLRYAFGWADFLMYYAVYLLLAPFALRALFSRFWAVVPLLSIVVFCASITAPIRSSVYLTFFVWQVYFFIGMTIARHRPDIIGWYKGLSDRTTFMLSRTIFTVTSVTLIVSAYLSFKTQYTAARINSVDWLPTQIQNGLTYLATHQSQFNHWFQNGRMGLGRPVVALLVLSAGWLLYQQHSKALLKHTGNFVNAIGRNSLHVFVAQAIAIPLIAALPISKSNMVVNTGLTVMLLGMMWLVAVKSSVLYIVGTATESLYISFMHFSYLLVTSIKDALSRLTAISETES